MWAEKEKYKNHFLQLEIKHMEPKHINELVNNGEFDFCTNLIGPNIRLIGFRIAFGSNAPADKVFATCSFLWEHLKI